MSNLSLHELKKRPYRIGLLADYIWGKMPLQTIDGRFLLVNTVKIGDGDTFYCTEAEHYYKFIDSLGKCKSRESIILTAVYTDNQETTTITSSKLAKTKEFGGEEKGLRLKKENMYLDILQNDIKTIGQPFSIICNDIEYKNIVRVEKVTNSAKADYALIDINNTPIFWISHKDIDGFQQWSGLSAFKTHPEVQNFINDIKINFNNIITPKTNRGRIIQDKNLKLQGVFGVDYGKLYGINNVHMVAVGKVKFSEIENHKYYIYADKSWYNTQETDFGDHDPVLLCTYRTDRNDFGIKNCRMSMYPSILRKWIDPIKG